MNEYGRYRGTKIKKESFADPSNSSCGIICTEDRTLRFRGSTPRKSSKHANIGLSLPKGRCWAVAGQGRVCASGRTCMYTQQCNPATKYRHTILPVVLHLVAHGTRVLFACLCQGSVVMHARFLAEICMQLEIRYIIDARAVSSFDLYTYSSTCTHKTT